MRLLHRPEELHGLHSSELRRLLERRFRQLDAPDAWGEFILVEPGDGLVLILSDDGQASVLIVPGEAAVSPEIRAFYRAHAEPPD